MDRNTIQKILIDFFISACLLLVLKLFNIAGFDPSETEINTNVSSSK
jgi:hypothetical protein